MELVLRKDVPMVWATDAEGNELLGCEPVGASADGLGVQVDPVVPLTGALVFVRGARGLLLVHDVWRGRWELPGGGVFLGETSEEAARREVLEESGQDLAQCRHIGYATFRRAGDGEMERADLFAARVDQERPFTANNETDGMMWWSGDPDRPQLGAIDAALIRWATPYLGS